MKIGIKGQDFAGKILWTSFERVPGAKEPQVRITTPSEQIYVSEKYFAEMVVRLFGQGGVEYRMKHGRTAE